MESEISSNLKREIDALFVVNNLFGLKNVIFM